MSVLSIRINAKKRKLLKIISALEEKTIGGLIESWIDEHIKKNKGHYASQLDENLLGELKKISEPAFVEWNNEEDDIYNDL